MVSPGGRCSAILRTKGASDNLGMRPRTFLELAVRARGALCLALVFQAVAGAQSPTLPSAFVGTWTARVSQSPDFDYLTVLRLVEGPVSTIEYTDLSCGGTHTVISAAPNVVTMRERITFGPCLDNGLVVLRLQGDTIDYQFSHETVVEAVATGTFTRQSGPPSGAPTLGLSRQGFVFRAQDSVVRQESLEIANRGGGELQWSVTSSTIEGGPWLSVSPADGTTTGGQPPSPVEVQVDPSGLAPGDYYGRLTVSANPGIASQTLTVAVRVVSGDAFVPVQVEPEGFLFVHTPPLGAASEPLTFTNPGSRPVNLQVEASFGDGVPQWFVLPALDEVLAPGDSLTIEILLASDFAPAVRNGEVRVTSSPTDGSQPESSQRIDMRLVVAAGSGGAPLTRQQGVCTPTRLVPVFTRLPLDFQVVSGWPIAMEAAVVDDCGAALTQGVVTSEFSNGDPLVAFEGLGEGRWVATWSPTPTDAGVTVRLSAASLAEPPIEGTVEVGGSVPESSAAPVLGAPPLSAISFARDQPISLGAYAALFGSQLAGSLTVADSLPLPDSLNETAVFIGGLPMPLLFASAGQVNGVVPYELAGGSLYSVLVQSGGALSAPLRVLVAQAQPALFSKDSSGGGQGLIERVSADGSRSLAEPGTPARPGDVLVIYASGLGPVTGDFSTGDASPTAPLAETVEPVSVLVGGAVASVSFAGLTPGFAGLYQVNAALPGDAPVGDAVPIVASVNEATSPSVTIAVGR